MNTLASTHPSGLRMTVSASPRMHAAELRGFLFRPEMLQRWVGPEAVVPARVDGLAMLRQKFPEKLIFRLEHRSEYPPRPLAPS